jgi:xanthine dehydrogenase accessory factor
MTAIVFLRGGGDLASGVALRLFRSGVQVVIAELAQPLAVRRMVSFSEAVYAGQVQVEGVTAALAADLAGVRSSLARREIPVLVDPQAAALAELPAAGISLAALVDGRMTKQPDPQRPPGAPLVIGLGPGYIAGQNCDAAVETKRGHFLGRVIWAGPTEADTGVPESVRRYGRERVLRAPRAGILTGLAEIGAPLQPGDPVAQIGDNLVSSPFAGVLRGLLHSGVSVRAGVKIGDVDPRGDPRYCFQVSDKALAVGGGVLEALLAQAAVRRTLWLD